MAPVHPKICSEILLFPAYPAFLYSFCCVSLAAGCFVCFLGALSGIEAKESGYQYKVTGQTSLITQMMFQLILNPRVLNPIVYFTSVGQSMGKWDFCKV